jgi:hypothetical protein
MLVFPFRLTSVVVDGALATGMHLDADNNCCLTNGGDSSSSLCTSNGASKAQFVWSKCLAAATKVHSKLIDSLILIRKGDDVKNI